MPSGPSARPGGAQRLIRVDGYHKGCCLLLAIAEKNRAASRSPARRFAAQLLLLQGCPLRPFVSVRPLPMNFRFNVEFQVTRHRQDWPVPRNRLSNASAPCPLQWAGPPPRSVVAARPDIISSHEQSTTSPLNVGIGAIPRTRGGAALPRGRTVTRGLIKLEFYGRESLTVALARRTGGQASPGAKAAKRY